MIYSRIAGTGSYLPKRVLSNADLEKIVDTSEQWIVERTGIRQRFIADKSETASSMAEIAAMRALEAAGMSSQDLDLIIVATSTPDKRFPSTACFLQQRLAISGCPAFDVTAACAGFVYALSVADRFIKTGGASKALIVGSEIMSQVVDWNDRSTCVLFGDGAGAAILEASPEPGILSTHLHASGEYSELLYLPTGLPSQSEESSASHIKMRGSELFKVVVNILGQSIDETLAANQLKKSDVNWLIPHQANIRIIQAAAKKLDLPMERVILTIAEQGNTSAASIPIALDQGIRDGRIKRGEKLLLEGFGGGLAWGSALITY